MIRPIDGIVSSGLRKAVPMSSHFTLSYLEVPALARPLIG